MRGSIAAVTAGEIFRLGDVIVNMQPRLKLQAFSPANWGTLNANWYGVPSYSTKASQKPLNNNAGLCNFYTSVKVVALSQASELQTYVSVNEASTLI